MTVFVLVAVLALLIGVLFLTFRIGELQDEINGLRAHCGDLWGDIQELRERT